MVKYKYLKFDISPSLVRGQPALQRGPGELSPTGGVNGMLDIRVAGIPRAQRTTTEGKKLREGKNTPQVHRTGGTVIVKSTRCNRTDGSAWRCFRRYTINEQPL